MNSAITFLLNRAKGVTGSQIRLSPAIFSPAIFSPAIFSKLHSTETISPPREGSLTSIIYDLGNPNADILSELDRWFSAGKTARLIELRNLTRGLQKFRRSKQALEVSEWRKDKWKKMKGGRAFTTSDHAAHLELIAQVRGLSAAKMYFENLKDKEKNERTYSALLNCYVKERLVGESLSLMEKMKEMGMVSTPFPYNSIMCLYTYMEEHEKVPLVLEEMKSKGISPNNYGYRLCINALGKSSDIEGVDKVLEEMEAQTQMVVDWNTYAVFANIYITAGLNEKAISMLKKSEERLEKKNDYCYNYLISLYCVLGRKEDVWRLWELMKENCNKVINRAYIAMLRTLNKLDELGKAEDLVNDWESNGNFFDFRVPNVLLVAYQQRGLLEKAEAMIDRYLKKGKNPNSDSWGIVAAGYAEKGEMGKACELMTNALRAYNPSANRPPKANAIRSILQYLGDEGEVEMVENFVGLLKNAMLVNRDVYHTLIKCNIRAGKDIDNILEKMKSDGIEPDENTDGIIASLKSQNLASI